MSNLDYEIKASADITPKGTLSEAVSYLTPDFEILTGSGFDEVDVGVGSALMVDDEIVVITAVSEEVITVARGCADTIPAPHAANASVWFFGTRSGSDEKEYLAGETIGVKILMNTQSLSMRIPNSPPNEITFVGRAAKPYPPGLVQANGLAWFNVTTLDSETDDLVLTWNHRDRLLQLDVLTGHNAGDIGPEPGTTYTLRAYTAANVLSRTISGITGKTITYTLGQAVDDLHLTPGIDADVPGYLTLSSVRDGLESFQRYTIPFTANAVDFAPGWGNGWGLSWNN
jgi:hypothetical protein